jgi:hypothetical protein
MILAADFDPVYASKNETGDQLTVDFQIAPPCPSSECFIGSYAPISEAGKEGRFFNNTYLLQSDRKFETVGTVRVRSGDLEKCRK